MLNIPLNSLSTKIGRQAGYLLIGFCVWLAVFQDKFSALISTQTFTGWDTHSYGFVYFLYFSDALKDGIIPFWNPFIQSGNFFPNFFNVGLFYPFELFFVALGWVVGPLLGFELMIQSAVVIGAIGSFFLLRQWKINPFMALIGAIFYALIVLTPVVGQIWYTISFSSLPWLIFACDKLSNKGTSDFNIHWMFFGLFYVFFISGGYLWLNLMNLLLAFSFVLAKYLFSPRLLNTPNRNLFSFFTSSPLLLLALIAGLYACIVLPCFLHLQFNYSDFFGDFASPDGRLRGLKISGQTAGHGSALETMIGNIDPLISTNQPWGKEGVFTYGGGWLLWTLFAVNLLTKWSKRQIYWVILLSIAITYSAGSDTLLGSLLMQIPIVNGNRYWLGVGTSYASIFLLFITVDKLNLIRLSDAHSKVLLIRLVTVLLIGIAFLIYLYAPVWEYLLILFNGLLLGGFILLRSQLARNSALMGLVVINIAYVLAIPYRAYSNPPIDPSYVEKIDKRNQSITVTKNDRKLASGTELNYYDTDWIYQKVPFAHGYNHLGNPQYWYVKNNPFLEKIVVVTQNARPAQEIHRRNLQSDNEYAEKVAQDVLSIPFTPTIEQNQYTPITSLANFSGQLSNLQVNPNSVAFTVEVNAPAHIILNMLYAPGWKVSIDGVEQQAYRVNHIFQGIDINAPGKYEIDFYYRPYLSMFLLLIPYAFLIGLSLYSWKQKLKLFRHK